MLQRSAKALKHAYTRQIHTKFPTLWKDKMNYNHWLWKQKLFFMVSWSFFHSSKGKYNYFYFFNNMVRVTCIGTWDQNLIFINWSTTKMKYDSLTSLLVLFIYYYYYYYYYYYFVMNRRKTIKGIESKIMMSLIPWLEMGFIQINVTSRNPIPLYTKVWKVWIAPLEASSALKVI